MLRLLPGISTQAPHSKPGKPHPLSTRTDLQRDGLGLLVVDQPSGQGPGRRLGRQHDAVLAVAAPSHEQVPRVAALQVRSARQYHLKTAVTGHSSAEVYKAPLVS